MLCVRAPAFEDRLIFLAQRTGKSKSYYVRLALQILFREMDSSELPLDCTHPFAPYQSVMQE